MKVQKIAFFGLFGQQNLGNEATLQAIMYNARRYIKDAEILCICTVPNHVSKEYNIPAAPISTQFLKHLDLKMGFWQNKWMKILLRIILRIPIELLLWGEAVKVLKGRQMLIIAGAGLLADFGTSSLGIPYQIFKWSIAAKMCRCKLAFVSVGSGPISHFLTGWFIKLALSMADYRSYRDGFSKEYLKKIGFKSEHDPVFPDLAFSLPGPILAINNERENRRPVIGVGIMDYYGVLGQKENGGTGKYWEFIKKLCTFVKWLLEKNYTVRLIIGDVLYDNRVKKDLLSLLEEPISELKDGQIIDEPIYSVEELVSKLAVTDIVVSPRFHNILLALMLCKPVISLSYHEKFHCVMAEFGLPEYCHNIDDLDIQKLIKQVIEIEKNANSFKVFAKQKTQEFRNALDKQYGVIFNEI